MCSVQFYHGGASQVEQSFTCSFTLHRWSLTHAHTLSPEVSFSHTCSRYITLPPSRNHLRLFSLTFITSTLPLANIHTHNPHRPFLYNGPAYVSHVCTLSLRMSLTHCLTPLFLIDKYDSSRAFCRMPLKVRLDE